MKRGSKRWWLGVVLLIGGTLLIASGLTGLALGWSVEPQFAASGSHEVRVEEGGRYYVWDHYRTWFEGRRVEHPKEFPADVRIAVRVSGGAGVGFVEDDTEGWVIGNHGKKSVGHVTCLHPVDLTIEVNGGRGERVLSFGPADEGKDAWRKLRGLGLGLIAVVLGLPLLCLGFLAQRRDERRRRKSAGAGSALG